jgi:oligoribonuclease
MVTENDLTPLHNTPFHWIIHQPAERLSRMNTYCTQLHTTSGLVADCIASTQSLAAVEQEILALLTHTCAPQTALLCGNSIHQDRAFIKKQMPQFNALLPYRMIDVSTLKELAARWYPTLPSFAKSKAHRAPQDIIESLDELRYYKQHMRFQ